MNNETIPLRFYNDEEAMPRSECTPHIDMVATESSLQVASPSPYSNLCKIVPERMLSQSQQLHYRELLRSTQDHSSSKGAILVDILNQTTNEFEEHWFPKKLCCNLNEVECTFYCYVPFLEDQKEELL